MPMSMSMSPSISFTHASISRSSRGGSLGAARVPGPRATLGARPAVLPALLPAELVELCLAQRHPAPSVNQLSLRRDQRHRAPLPRGGDRRNQHHAMGVTTILV